MSESTVECRTPQSQLTLSAELRRVIHERNILTTRTRMKVLSELDDISKISEGEKQVSLRNKAIQEILTSEVSYLHQLEILMQYFMEPLKNMNFICPYDYSILFGHLDTLYKVNGELLNEIKENTSSVGEAFLKMAPFFKLYSVYAYDYKNILNLLQEMQQKNPDLWTFVQQQEVLPEVNASLGSLLITPIQRVPRYRLLLREVLLLTPLSHPEYSSLQKSLLEVEKAAEHINNLVRDQESMLQMIELQKKLHSGRPCIVAPGRRLLKEGPLMKVSLRGRKAHSRYFILFNDLLMYCKETRPSARRDQMVLLCCCVLPLKKCRVDEVIGRGMFKVSCHNETLLLYSTSQTDAESWVKELRAAVRQYHECRQTLRKDSSSRRPMRLAQLAAEQPESPFNATKSRKRRRSNTENEIHSPKKQNQNVFKKLWRKSLQDNPEIVQELQEGIKKEFIQGMHDVDSTEDVKDSLYPLRDSLCRKALSSCKEKGKSNSDPEIAQNSKKVTFASEDHHGSMEDTRLPLEGEDFQVGGFNVVWRTLTNLGHFIRKCMFRRVPHVPAFE